MRSLLRDSMMFDPNQMSKLAKQLGIKMTEIKANKVVIEGEETIIIENPNVIQMNVKGQKMFQITGRIKEVPYTEEDIKMVMEKASVDRIKAIELLDKAEGDIAQAILYSQEV